MSLIAVYLTTNEPTIAAEFDVFYEELQEYMRQDLRGDILLISGDSNATVGMMPQRGKVQLVDMGLQSMRMVYPYWTSAH